ncbi:MAG: Ku protein [Phycisphaerales bacterium]|nr:Ku protein [Phycisphaerales bacterium]
MPRPIWKGHISFGLVNVPVQLHAAERRSDLQLHLVDSRNHARIRYDRVNTETGEEVPWNEIVKGYEYSDGNYVILSDAELKRAAPEVTKRIEIEAFVALADIDILYFDRPYYLEPAKGGDKGYVLLRRALADTGRVGIARVVIRTRQHMAAMIPHGDVLVLELLRYAQEIASPADLNIPSGTSKASGVTPQELKVARTLVESMAAEWAPAKYHDEYRDALMKWIDKRIKSGQTERLSEPLPPEAEEPPPTLNFMELLKKSLKQAPARKAPPRPAKRSKKPAKANTAGQRRRAG